MTFMDITVNPGCVSQCGGHAVLFLEGCLMTVLIKPTYWK